MAITINPMTHVISVPKADLVLIQAAPEVLELDLNWFRLQLRALEDNQSYNICMLKTHTHNTEVTLAGLTYARIIEILAPYTVEFEDGQYTVNCVGANHNLSDRKVPNQVSLIVNNAAGLITNAQIEYSSYQNGVTVDVTTSNSGTLFPIGTPQKPVNNIDDAYDIAVYRGFTVFYVIGDLALSEAVPVMTGYTFIGQGMDRTHIDIDPLANVEDCAYREAHVSGTLDGNSRLVECLIDNLIYVKGYIEQCVISPGTIELAGTEEAHFLDCWSGVPGTDTPVIDMGGSGQALALRNYNGGIKLENKTGADSVSIDLNSGQVKLAATVTAGTIVLRGVGTLTEDLSSGATVINQLVNNEAVAEAVFDAELADHTTSGTYGAELATKADVKASASTKYYTVDSATIVYGSAAAGSSSNIDVRDGIYWQIQEDAADGLTVEFVYNLDDNAKAGQIAVFGRYVGTPSSAHYIDAWAYNYESAAWETLKTQFMPGGITSDDEFTYEYFERNIDRSNNNEVKIRLIHSVASYNASHYLHLDSVLISGVDVIAAEDIANAVWTDANGLTVLSELAFIKAIEGGRWELSGSQMIFYDDDNITEIARFNLTYDANNYPIERTRV